MRGDDLRDERRMSGSTSAVAGPVLLAAGLLVVLEIVALLPFRNRFALAVFAGALVALVLHRRSLLGRPALRRPLVVGFAVSVLPIIASLFLGHPDPLLVLTSDSLPTLTGWCVLLALLPLIDAERTPAPEDWTPAPRVAAGFLVLVFAALALAHWIAVGAYALVSDEVVFLVQSRWISLSQLVMPMEPELARYFIMRKVGYLDGHLFGMYPPGWPALLAAFRGLGLEWWATMFLGTASVALVYLIGRRLHSSRAGAIAAVILASSPMFMVAHAGYMSHAAAMTGLLAGTWCLLAGMEAAGWRRLAAWMGAGILLGFVVTVRPLTGLAIGLSIGCWMLHRAWLAGRSLPLVMSGCVALGGVLPAALFMAYNQAVFGEPLALGHSVMHPGMYSLGFGQRGFRVLDADLNWVAEGFPFGPSAAVQSLVRRLVGMNVAFIPIGLLLPIVAIAVASGFRIAWSRVAMFAILPAALFFYWSSSLRQYGELLPLVVVAVAMMLATTYQRWPRLGTGLVVLVLASNVVSAAPRSARRETAYRAWATSDYGGGAPARRMVLESADSLARVHGRILLFSREATRFDNQIDRLYQFNAPRFDGPIVVARDRGPLNAALMLRYPDRVPFLVEDRNGRTPATFTRLDRPPDATGGAQVR